MNDPSTKPKPLRFALVGAAGFVAKRHFEAIKHVGGELVAALDLNDSVGLIDSFAPEADFFTEPERFDRYLNRRSGELDYVVVCSPNYLHDSHCRWALRSGANAICEKPLVLKPHNIDQLQRLEEDTGRRVYPILQLRYHPEIAELKRRVEAEDSDAIHTASVTYITRRGKWYLRSWKGDVRKSGGIATNLGVHFFDMLSWVFGPWSGLMVTELSETRGAGVIDFARTRAHWTLSTRYEDLPDHVKDAGGYAYRDLRVDDEKVADYSQGFTSLHNLVYEAVLGGHGLALEDARQAIEMCDLIRQGEGKYQEAKR